MMCAATVNWTLVADIKSPPAYVTSKSTIKIQGFFNVHSVHKLDTNSVWRIVLCSKNPFCLGVGDAIPSLGALGPMLTRRRPRNQ